MKKPTPFGREFEDIFLSINKEDVKLLSPDSSESVEQRLIKSEAPASETGQGSNLIQDECEYTHYVVIRKELSGGIAMAQAGHAIAKCANKFNSGSYPKRARMICLRASKAKLKEIYNTISLSSGGIGHSIVEFTEPEGKLANVMTAVSFVAYDKSGHDQLFLDKAGIRDLKPWDK